MKKKSRFEKLERFGKFHFFAFLISKSVRRSLVLLKSFIYQNYYSFGKGVVIDKGVEITSPNLMSVGENVYFEPFCRVYHESLGNIEFGNNVRVGRHSVIDFTGGVRIGDNVVISESVKCYSHSHDYNPNNPSRGIPKNIESHVWIGSNVVITENCTSIGENSIIAAGSIVTKSVPPYSLFAGNPARLIKTIGL